MNKSMKLIELRIENIKRIKAVEIHPGPGVTAIGGRNAQGKTSVLDCIEMALAGERHVQPQPVRQGEESGRTVLTFDSGLIVKREFQAGGGSRLVVSDPSGKIKAPQTFLDALTGKGIAFDPLAFLSMEPLKQLETLKRLVGVDFSALDDRRKTLNDERALAGRDVTGRKGQIETMPEYPGVPAQEVSAADLSGELIKALEFNAQIERLAQAVDAARAESERANRAGAEAAETLGKLQDGLAEASMARDAIESEPHRIEDEHVANNDKRAHARAQIASWQKIVDACDAKERQLCQQRDDLNRVTSRIKALEGEIETATAKERDATRGAAEALAALTEAKERLVAAGQTADLAPVKAKLAGIEDTNRKVRANLARRQLEASFREAKEQYEELTRQIDALDREKAKMVGAAKFPVDGLGLGLQGVLYKDLPFQQASSAEQYRVSTAIGFELCPKTGGAIRIGLIRNASLLDDDSRKIIAETAAKYDAQLILEVVTDSDNESGVDLVIEDGEARQPRRVPSVVEQALAAVGE